MTTYLMLAQAIMLGVFFVHSVCVLSKTQFHGWLNPRWLSHVLFVAFALYTGLNMVKGPYVFDAERAFLEAAVLLGWIADYRRYKRHTHSCKPVKILGE